MMYRRKVSIIFRMTVSYCRSAYTLNNNVYSFKKTHIFVSTFKSFVGNSVRCSSKYVFISNVTVNNYIKYQFK